MPACAECNGRGSRDDDEFQAYLAIHVGGWDERGTEFLRNRGKANLEGNAKRLRSLREDLQLVEVVDSMGASLGQAPAVLWNGEAHDAVMERMIRGLYWHHTGQILPSDAVVEPHWYRGIDLDMLKPFLKVIEAGWSGAGIRRFRNDEVVYAYMTHPEAPGHSAWLFQFYGKHSCGGDTRPAGVAPEDLVNP